MTLGHESAGIVMATGAEVTTVKEGDRVALEPGIPCRYCEYCRKGVYNLCRRMRFAATPPYDGTLCDIYRLPEDFCHLLPETLTLEEGAMAEPLSVAVHVMIRQAAVEFGTHVVVFGAGPIGLLCCAVARAFGAEKVVVVDINESRLQFAKNYAATNTFDAKTVSGVSVEEGARRLLEQTGIRVGGADIVVDASGAESSIRLGIHVSRPGGTFVQAGMGRDEVNFPIAAMCSKELKVHGSFRYGPGDYETAIKLMASKKVNVADLITDRFSFDKVAEAFSCVRGEGIKSIIAGPSFSGK